LPPPRRVQLRQPSMLPARGGKCRQCGPPKKSRSSGFRKRETVKNMERPVSSSPSSSGLGQFLGGLPTSTKSRSIFIIGGWGDWAGRHLRGGGGGAEALADAVQPEGRLRLSPGGVGPAPRPRRPILRVFSEGPFANLQNTARTRAKQPRPPAMHTA